MTTLEMPASQEQEQEPVLEQSPQERFEQEWADEDEQLLEACLRYDPWNEFLEVLQEKTSTRKLSGGQYGLLLAFCFFMSSAMLRLKAR
jgi:hypothetical protein